jgi:hypothetical protein
MTPREKLSAGAREDGVHLSRNECHELLQMLTKQPRRRGPKPKPELRQRDEDISRLITLLRTDSNQRMVYILRDIEELCGIGRSQVYAILRRHPVKVDQGMDRAACQALINSIGRRLMSA